MSVKVMTCKNFGFCLGSYMTLYGSFFKPWHILSNQTLGQASTDLMQYHLVHNYLSTCTPNTVLSCI